MTIRTYQSGDEVTQVRIYNEAAAALPKFKSASVDEVRRRMRDPDFDPGTRFFALAAGRPVAYATYQLNGRVSFPWCIEGHAALAGPLLDHVLDAMRQRGLRKAWAAYRSDWPAQRDFFLARGFAQVREMLNYVLNLVDMPTPAARASSSISALGRGDLATVVQLGASVLRVSSVPELEKCLFHNPYFPPESLFCLRSRSGGQPVAVGILVHRSEYANPHQLDSAMPCFRLGAFGTENLTHKRINGLFSFLAADNRDLSAHGLDLLGYASTLVHDVDVETFAAQVPSDAPHLVRFYKSLFRRQGGFPIFEREL
jgi:hypothetical protein